MKVKDYIEKYKNYNKLRKMDEIYITILFRVVLNYQRYKEAYCQLQGLF